MADTIVIILRDIATTVLGYAVGMKTGRRNASNLAANGAATPLLLLILLAITATAHADDRTPRPGGRKGYSGNIIHPHNIGGMVNPEILGSNQKTSNVETTKLNMSLLENVNDQRTSTAKSILRFCYNNIRNHLLTQVDTPPEFSRGIVYWMYRDQRVQDNWAMLYAQKLAIKHTVPLHIVFCTPTATPEITLRQYKFMIEGLKEVESEFRNLSMPFHFLYGGVVDVLPDFVRKHNIGGIVVDFLPLREFMDESSRLGGMFINKLPVVMVDAHNIFPCWSNIRENAKLPLHRDVNSKLNELMTEFPPFVRHPFNVRAHMPEPINWEETEKNFKIDRSVLPVSNYKPGYREGIFELENFLKYRLKNYDNDSRDATKNGLSNLSPWLHFGQISAQRVMLELNRFTNEYSVNVDRFKDELYQRRERSDLFCYRHLNNYDSVDGARYWAKSTLDEHRNDTRIHLYSREMLENAQTHDEFWNAAQLQMKVEGKMHRVLRPYWAKKNSRMD